MTKTLSAVCVVALTMTLSLQTFADQAVSNEAAPDAGATTQELVSGISDKRAKKLSRAADKSLKRIKKNGDYIRHRVIELNLAALVKNDPLPVSNFDAEVDTTWNFDMLFTPFDGETYLLKNRENFNRNVSGYDHIQWSGDIYGMAGDLVGTYRIATVKGEYGGGSYFLFYNNDAYGLRDMGRKTEKVIYQKRMNKLDEMIVDQHKSGIR